jgi:hypothetical protein
MMNMLVTGIRTIVDLVQRHAALASLLPFRELLDQINVATDPQIQPSALQVRFLPHSFPGTYPFRLAKSAKRYVGEVQATAYAYVRDELVR